MRNMMMETPMKLTQQTDEGHRGVRKIPPYSVFARWNSVEAGVNGH